MATYPFEVQLAWDVVNQFTIDWQASPFAWEREIDVQAELFNRLRLIMKYTGRELVSINPPIVRVTQEPSVKYLYEGEHCTCYPDILIRNAPDSDYKNSWACELKFDNSRGKDWDIEKLQHLCDQKIVHYGCWLNIKNASTNEMSVNWNRDARPNIWLCDVFLPSQQTT